MVRGLSAVGLLICSNLFMTLAWYGQVMFKSRFERIGLVAIIFISWAVAFFEYCFMIPANRIGSEVYGGPFNIWELKVIQEVVSLTVFAIVALELLTSLLDLNLAIGNLAVESLYSRLYHA